MKKTGSEKDDVRGLLYSRDIRVGCEPCMRKSGMIVFGCWLTCGALGTNAGGRRPSKVARSVWRCPSPVFIGLRS